MEKMKTELPGFAALELTYRCNHFCLFCSCPWEDDASYRKNELSTEEWKNVIDTLASHGIRAFSLTGGEASLREDLKEIICHIRSNKLGMNIISNGRMLDDSFMDFLAEQKVSICISLPGIKTFKDHTGIDNVSHVLSLFEKAKERGIGTTANITVTKKNLHELYENIACPLLYGAKYILLNRFLPGGRGLDNTEYLLSVEEVNQMLDIAEDVLSKAGRYGHVGTELPLCVIKQPEKYKRIRVGTGCAAAKELIIVDPSGFIRVCNHSPQALCKYDELDSLGSNPYWMAFRNRDYRPEMCKNCSSWGICDGGCREAAHVFSGSIKARDPLFDSVTIINRTD